MSTFKDLFLVNLYPWVYAIACFVIIPIITKMQYIPTRKIFFTPKGIISLMKNFYSAGVIQRFLQWKEMSLWEKNLWIWFRVRFGFPSRIFPEHEASCLYFALIQEIPQQVCQQLRPKPKSSGFLLSMLQYQQTRCLSSSCLSRNSLKIISDRFKLNP